MLKFIIDTQLPPSLATYLKVKGFDSIHTTYFPDGQFLKDNEIIHIAKNEDRVIVTKDSDFLDHFLLRGAPPCVLLLETGNIRNKHLIDLFEKQLDRINNLFNEGNKLVIIQKNNLFAY
ncbi:MAG: DUF5615 family PIN-like protein [Bacteroidetes bacterium]|nr:DUF5615 family PIN-like protein [Bacteroidota bacterium]